MKPPDRDLDRLVNELNTAGTKGSPDAFRLEEWLAILRARGGSDLYLVSGVPPTIRLNGVVRQLAEAPLDGEEIETAVLPALPIHAVERYRRHGIADASLRRSGNGRFRINLHRERGRAAASIRALPLSPPQ